MVASRFLFYFLPLYPARQEGGKMCRKKMKIDKGCIQMGRCGARGRNIERYTTTSRIIANQSIWSSMYFIISFLRHTVFSVNDFFTRKLNSIGTCVVCTYSINSLIQWVFKNINIYILYLSLINEYMKFHPQYTFCIIYISYLNYLSK